MAEEGDNKCLNDELINIEYKRGKQLMYYVLNKEAIRRRMCIDK